MQKTPPSIQRIEDIWLDDARHAPQGMQKLPAVQLIGAPDDRAIRNVGGRLGAAQGPRALREVFGRMMVGIQSGIGQVRIGKGKDVAIGSTIEDAHRALRKETRDLLAAGVLPIVLGGGHDFGYPHVAGSHDVLKDRLSVINVDAHLDVRPVHATGITSGSPFFLAIENKVLNPKFFHEFGIQEHCNYFEAVDYLQIEGAKISLLNALRLTHGGVVANFKKALAEFKKAKKQIVVSFDVDAVNLAWAPGVSAPQADGFTSEEFLEMVRVCALDENVCSLGFFELSPPLDENGKTTKLVATAIHQFISYYGLRKPAKKQPRLPSRASRARRGR